MPQFERINNLNSNMQNQKTDLANQLRGQYKTIENAASNIQLAKEHLQQSKSPPIIKDQREQFKQINGPGPYSFRQESDSCINYQQFKETSPFAAYSESGAMMVRHNYNNSIECGHVKSGQQQDSQSQNYDFLFDPEKGDGYSQNQSSHISSGDAIAKPRSFSPNTVDEQIQNEYLKAYPRKILTPEIRPHYETEQRLKEQYVDESEEDHEVQQYYDEEYNNEVNVSEEDEQINEQEFSPTTEPVSPETRHLRTIQEETDPLQERSNSVVSKDKNFRSIPHSEAASDAFIPGEERSPLRRHQQSAPYPATFRSTYGKNQMKSFNSTHEKSFQSPETQKSDLSGQAAKPPEDIEEMLDPFDELCNAKLSLMAEKTANRFHMKEMLTQISLINDLFYRKQVQQEMILNNESDMQLKSFVELSLSMSSNEMTLSQNLRNQILEEIKSKTNQQITAEIRQQTGLILKRFTEFMKGERNILNSLAKEKERNAFLEQELGKKEYRSIFSGDKSSQQKSLPSKSDEQQKHLIQKMEMMSMDQEEAEGYINEIETQLQEARQGLLDAKLELSDQKVENVNLQQQLAATEEQIRTLIDNSRKFEEIFEKMRLQIETLEQEKNAHIKTNQKMKDLSDIVISKLKQNEEMMNQQEAFAIQMQRQNDARSAMDQVQSVINQSSIEVRSNSPTFKNQEFNEIKKHIDQLNRQLVEYQKNKQSLELVEQSLLQKIDKKQQENLELKNLINEIRSQLDLKSEAISKAQKIIEKLTEKSENDEQLIVNNHDENDKLKKEIIAKQQRIKDLSLQLDEIHRKQQQQVDMMNETLNRELQELKGAIKDYQIELEVEKQKYSNQLTSLNEELDQRIFERDEWCRRVRELENDLERVFKEKTGHIRQVEDQAKVAATKSKEREDELQTQYEHKSAEAQSQILYLQKRLKEIAEETAQLQNPKSLNKKTDDLGLLSTVLKKEIELLGKEVIAIRETLRMEQTRENTMLNQKLSLFDEFKLNFLDQLILWDKKSAELANLANRYYSYLEDQRKMFLKMKLIVNEKDQVIEKLKKQIIVREQAHECTFNSMKAELHMQNHVIREDMMQTIRLLEKKNETKEHSCINLEERLDAFKKEFTQLLEDKDYSDNQYQKIKSELDLVEQSYLNLKTGTLRQNDRLAEAMGLIEGVNQMKTVSDQLIERSVRNLVQESKLNFEDNVRIREELESLEKVRADDKQNAFQKFQKLEQDFENYRKNVEQKEEQLNAKFYSNENKIKQELQSAEAYAEKVSSEAQVRERQLKKIQFKREEDAKKLDDLNVSIARLAKEKLEIFAEKERLENKIVDNQRVIEEMLSNCEYSKHLFEKGKEELAFERQKVRDNEFQVKELQRMLSQEIANVEKAKEQFNSIDTKVKALEKRSDQQQKENNDLFRQVGDAQLERDRALISVKQLQKEIEKVNTDLDLARSDIEFYIQEVKNFENTVLRLTKDLDEERGKDELIEELQNNLQTFDQQIDLQANQIFLLQEQLRGPKKMNSMVQTEDSGILEIQYARQEIINCQMVSDEAIQEADQLREALQRSNFEVCKLIDDKRELEDLIEKLNQGINYHRQNSQVNLMTSQRMMISGRGNSAKKVHAQNNSPLRQTPLSTGYLGNNTDSVNEEQNHMIFHEKENYINQLENEINQMRREIEQQRETIILLDLNSIPMDTNRPTPESCLSGRQQNFANLRSQNQQMNQNVQNMNEAIAMRTPYNSYMPQGTFDEKSYLRETHNENQNPNIQSTHISSYNAESVPIRLNPHTMNYSTLSRTLTGRRDLNDTTGNYQIIAGSIAETNEEAQQIKYQSHNDQFSLQSYLQEQRKLDSKLGSYEGFLNPNASFQNYQSVGECSKTRPFASYLNQ